MAEIDFDQLNGDMELNCALRCYFCVKYLFYSYEIKAFFTVFSQVSVIECVALNEPSVFLILLHPEAMLNFLIFYVTVK